MSSDLSIGRSSLACIFCFFLSSNLFSLYAQTTVSKRTAPAFKPPAQTQRIDSKSREIEKKPKLALEPIVIYYGKRKPRTVAETPTTTNKNLAELLKPITIYYRTWGPPSPVVSTSGKSDERNPERRREPLKTSAVSAPIVTEHQKGVIRTGAPSLAMTSRQTGQLKSEVTSPAVVSNRRPEPLKSAEAPASLVPEKANIPVASTATPKQTSDVTTADTPQMSTAPPTATRIEDPEPNKVSVAPDAKVAAAEPAKIAPVETSTDPKPAPDETSPTLEGTTPPIARNAEKEPAASATSKTEVEAEPATGTQRDRTSDVVPVQDVASDTASAPVNIEAASADANPPLAPSTESSTTAPAPNAHLNAIALNNSAVELSKNSQFKEAEGLLLKAIEQDSSIYKFYRNLSIVYENTKRFEKALEAAEKAAALAPREPSVLMQLCGMKLITGKDAEAVACYEKLNEIAPPDNMTLTSYGVALLGTGKLDKAVVVLEKARASVPNSSVTLNTLGMAYYQQKRLADAVTTFKSAVEADPERCEIRFNLAVAQLAMRNRDGAISQYRLIKERNSELANQLFQIIFQGKVLSVDRLKGH